MEDKGKLAALVLTSGFNQAADTLEGLARALRSRSTYMNHVADEAMDWEPARAPSEAEVLAMVSEIMGEGVTEARAISLTAKRLALPYDLTVRALKRD